MSNSVSLLDFATREFRTSMFVSSYEKPSVFVYSVISPETIKESFALQENETRNLNSDNPISKSKNPISKLTQNVTNVRKFV